MVNWKNFIEWSPVREPNTSPTSSLFDNKGFMSKRGPDFDRPQMRWEAQSMKERVEEFEKAEAEELNPETLTVAELLGRTLPRFYDLGNGLYWDDKTKEVRKLALPSITFGEGRDETYYNHSERRQIARDVKAKKKRMLRKEERWFKDLNCYAALIEQKGDLFSLIGDPTGYADTLPQDVYNAIIGIRKLFENGDGENFILSYFVWFTNEIAREILENRELKEKFIKKPEDFTRDRNLSLHDMFIILLTMAGDNLNNEVYEYFKLKPSQATPQAFVQRRNQIKHECYEYYFTRLTKVCYIICKCMPATDIFSEFASIFAVDGSDINVALNPSDEENYIDSGKEGKGWNQLHLNAMFDVRLDIFANALIQAKKKTHETKAAVEMIRSMEFNDLSLLLGDRGYACLNLLETILRKDNLDCLIRAKEDWIKEVAQLPMEEFDRWITIHVITTQTNYDKERIKRGEAKYLSGVSKFGKYKTSKVWDYESEVDVRFRVVRLKLDSGYETLITTLDENKYPPERIKELYFLRWGGVENAFRVLKWDNHLAQMHCRKLDFAKQEIWARLAMFNIVSCVVNCAYEVEKHQLQWDVKAAKALEEQKHKKIINRRFATYVVCDCFRNAGHIHQDVIQLILRYKTPVRAGRSFKRDMKAIGFVQFFYR